MSALSLRKQLLLIATAPLIAFLWLSISSVWNSYGQYSNLKGQMVVQALAMAGGKVAQVLPAEAFATAENAKDRRLAVNAALAELESAYSDWQAQGKRDEAIEKAFEVIASKEVALSTYRANVDAGTATSDEALFVLQPASAAGLELVRRSGASIQDLELARLIDGYYALMQVNDAGLIEIRLGEQYLAGQQLDNKQFAFFLHAQELRQRFTPLVREFLPGEIVEAFDGFVSGAGGQALAASRLRIEENSGIQADPAALADWTQYTGMQAEMLGGLIARTDTLLKSSAANKLDALKTQFLKGAIIALCVSLLVLGLSFAVERAVSRMVRATSDRMKALASGDRNSPIPFTDRSDEIGEMARSVEVFRDAAIRNAELEAEADENRSRAERERVEMQARAEADAEARLTKATGTLAAGLKRLASGDLRCEIDEQFAPQFEALRHDFNSSVQQLRDVLISVGRSAHAVSGGSGEISQASDDLSKRTEQQAASLEETAAALEEITANVTATSRRTGEARDIVRNTRSRAEQSGVVVGNAVTAMERIEHASRQINQIISVIDEIAFQTNLLALNAGVEAARAGEAGKGFAVVAQEVRELAQRSANAAKEIKALIANSEVAVSEGVKLVHETGDGLTAIAGLVQAINEHMDAISSAAQEQSIGLSEVNHAVNHMDQATQKNAAMVEEMNAASAGLADEARGLAALLQRFRTNQDVATRYHEAGSNWARISA
ncbi:methyl-accepting chemotaxis protein [Rhizobium sp. CSW-27]|uniref:methyl-accepting chemotaxis protein n=1 Tax=Rhizobium sp. CSW-27 TaxID=2839985 RepID=UPI001C019CFB|nr:methyl-accepting chemotaxis protein [Rhizobium sp. CSW-27]MBT9373236.1 methyl-accepting chemotaxis protein [Rhizobium sp. CSW-27]